MTTTNYLTVKQVAKSLGVHINTVEGWLRSGKLRGVKVGGKLWRVPAIALEEFLGDKGKKK